MKKISTLFKKNPSNLGLVTNEVDPNNQWVFDGEGVPHRKFDGSACAIIDGVLYKRYDAKHGKKAPEGAIPCQEPDTVSGHHPHWVKCYRHKLEDKYFWEAFDNYGVLPQDGTYELIGEKIQGNPEKISGHKLIPHNRFILSELIYTSFTDHTKIILSFDYIKKYLETTDIEGIVFHHKTDGRMCKIRKSDFGIKRL